MEDNVDAVNEEEELPFSSADANTEVGADADVDEEAPVDPNIAYAWSI